MQRNVQAGIWLIGIGILALTNFWWPGIMFVIAASSLASGSIQGALWLAGIGVLGLTDFWWPGILFIVGLSLLVGGFQRTTGREKDPRMEDRIEPIPEPPAGSPVTRHSKFDPATPLPPPDTDEQAVSSSREWLPESCPACGGPVTPRDAIWHSDERAACPYCNTILKPATAD